MASNITRKKVGNKVYTYNSGKLIHVLDTGSGDTKNYDITKNNKKTTSTSNRKNADGTWKSQTMVTGSYFGAGSKKQNNTVKETKPKYVAPTPIVQTRQVSVSGNKNKYSGSRKNADGTWKQQTMVTGDYFGEGSKKGTQDNKQKGITPVISMRDRIADRNRGKSYVIGKGYVNRGSDQKAYSIDSIGKLKNDLALAEADLKKAQEGYDNLRDRATQDFGSDTAALEAAIQGYTTRKSALDFKNNRENASKLITEKEQALKKERLKYITNDRIQRYYTDIANKETLTKQDEDELKYAQLLIREWSFANSLDYSDSENRAALNVLSNKIEARLKPTISGGAGMVDAMVPGLDYIKENAEKETKKAVKGTAYGKGIYKNGDPNIDYQKANPIAYSAGQMIGSIITMEAAGSAVGSSVSKALGAATKAGKISAAAAKWIGIGANNTGLAAIMTTKEALRKDYDWNNFGTDFLKQALMFNVMGYSAQGINSALGSLLTKGGKIGSFVFTGGKQFSNKWQTVSKLITAAGSAGAGVASTIPFNTKEENDALLNQWITLTAFQGITSILGGLSAGREQAETAAKGIKESYRANEAAKDIKGQSETLNRAADGISAAEADYKAAIRAEAEGRAELADQLFDQAGKTAREIAKMIYGPDSAGMYGVKQSDKEAIMSALDMILKSTGNSVNMSSTGAQSGPTTPVLPGTTSSPMQLTDGAGVTPAGSETNNIQTPTLDMYAGGKANVDAILGRQPSGSDNLPTIAKYGGNDLANGADAVIKGSNALALNLDSTSMITKYAGQDVSNEVKEDMYLAAAESNDSEKASRLVAEKANQNGYNIEAYHRTSRADRVGDTFLPERATSGPMAFFTDSKEIADNYANDKRDTSLAYDDSYSDYYSQFRTNSNGVEVAISDTWRNLSSSKKADITERAKHITLDENGENIIYDPNTNNGLGNFDQYLLREHNGNAIEALIESWLVDGNLYGEEGRFTDVLRLAGIEDVNYMDPGYTEPKTYHVFLRIQNPFDTANVSEELLNGLKDYAEANTGLFNKEYNGADLWDKNRWTVDEWVARATEDIQNGTTYAWTSIPDFVSGYLKELGYDGIKDLGGKYSGVGHTVYIPFASEQIKSAEPFEYDDNGDIIPLEERFNNNDKSIRYSLNDNNGGLSYNENSEVFDRDERWVGLRESGGFKRLCESTASYEERLNAAEDIRRAGGYEETDIDSVGSSVVADIVTDESMLPEDAITLREYNRNKHGVDTKFFIGDASVDTAEGVFTADAFINPDGVVYVGLNSKGMLSSSEHDCFHAKYDLYQKETDAFAANILQLLEKSGDFDVVWSSYSDKYPFLTDGNELFQEILADVYAHKLTLSNQSQADQYIKELDENVENGTANEYADPESRFHVNKEVPLRDIVPSLIKYSDIKKNKLFYELYNDAKNGNEKSAVQLFMQLPTKKLIDVISNYDSDVFLCPVQPTESSSNIMPFALAKIISNGFMKINGTGHEIIDFVFKKQEIDSNGNPLDAKSREMEVWERMKLDFPGFDIAAGHEYNELAGKKIVLIDDNVTSGRTARGLKRFLEEHGAMVVDICALSVGGDSSERIMVTDRTWAIIERDLSDYIEFAKKEGVKRDITREGLTEREAKVLIKKFRSRPAGADEDAGSYVGKTGMGQKVREDFGSNERGIKTHIIENGINNIDATQTSGISLPKNSESVKPKLNSKLSKQYDSAVKEFTDNAFNLMNIPNRKAVRADLKAAIEKIAANAFETGSVNMEEVTGLVRQMWDAGITYDNYILDNYPELKSYFRTTPIKVNDTIKGDIPDYNAWRRSQMGSLLLSDARGTAVDVLYQELNSRYPELFPEDIINPTEQLLRMADVRKEMRGKVRANDELYSDEEKTSIAQQSMQLVNKLEKSINDIATESRGEVIPGYDAENLASLEAQDPAAQDPNWINLQQNEPAIESDSEKLNRWKETRQDVAATDKLLDVARRVSKLSKTASPELKAQIEQIVGELNTVTKGITDGTRITLNKKIEDYKRFVEEAPGAKKYVRGADGRFTEDPYISNLFKRLNGMNVADMTRQDVWDLTRGLQALEHEYKTAKKEIRERNAAEISDLGKRWIQQMKTAGAKKTKNNSLMDFFTVTTLRPQTFFKEIDGYSKDGVGQRFYEDFYAGEKKMIDFQMRAEDLFADFINENKNLMQKEWAGKKAKWHDTGIVIDGKPVKMTSYMRMALYTNSKGYANMRHIVGGQYVDSDGKMHTYEGGGITIPNETLFKQGKFDAAEREGSNFRITESQLKKIIDEMPEVEKKFADIAGDGFFNGLSRTGINETSMALDGYEKAMGGYYYPIVTDKNYTSSEFESLMYNGTIEGMGMLKDRVAGANNPILLRGLDRTLQSHITATSKYYGLAVPIRNFTKVYYYSETGESGRSSVMSAMNTRMGTAGERYLNSFMKSLESGSTPTDLGKTLNQIRSNYAGAVLTFNPGVVLKQAASYPTAAAYLGWNNIMKGMTRTVDTETVKKYSVYYRYRSKGNYTMDLGDVTKEITATQKAPWMLNWIQQMDNAAVKKLWGACECYVEQHYPNLKKGSEEYLKKVGETLDNATALTQPNYTKTQRPGLLRSENEVVKSLTMFQTQRMQNYNILFEAGRELQYYTKYYNDAKKQGKDTESMKKDIKNAKKNLGRAVTSILVAAAMIAGIDGLNELLKGNWDKFKDEEGKLSFDAVLKYLGKDAGASLAGNVIGGSEMYSFISSRINGDTYYGVQAPQIGAINDLTDMISSLGDAITGVVSGSKSPKTLFRSGTKLGEQIAQLFGVPAANIRKYVFGMIGNVSPEFKAEYEDLMYGTDLKDVKSASTESWTSTLFGGMADFDAQFNNLFEQRNGKGITTANRDEMKRIFSELKDTTGDVSSIFISDPDAYSYNGISYDLNQADKDSIRAIATDEASANINKLMASKAFTKLSDEQKLKAIKEINSMAAETAKNTYLSNHNQSVEPGKEFDKVSYALFKAYVTDDMTTTEKKQALLDLNFNDYATASVYAKAFETKSTKEENTIAYKMEHSSKSAAEIIRESLKEKTEKEKTAAETVDNTAATKIKEAEGYTLPNYKASTLQSIADMGISPEDYAYVSDRVDGHEDKVDYIKGLPFDKTTQQSLVDDLIMGDKAHSKMQVAEDDYNIPSSVYIDTYMFGYESTGSKKERNQKIEDYVNSLPGLNDSQKEYLYWANQVYRKKDAVGGGEEEASGSGSSGSGKRSSGGRRRSSGRRSSGSSKKKGSGSGGSSATDSGAVPKVTVKAAPSISRKTVSGIAKTSISKYIARNLKAQTEAQRNADYATQVKNIDNNVFMTAKQKAAAKKRLKAAFGK